MTVSSPSIGLIAAAWPRGLPPFRPPWWLRSGHAQTLAAAYWTARLPAHAAMARHVPVSDHDTVVVHDDCPQAWRPGGRAALLLHGLGGSHRSPLLVRIAAKLVARGVRVFRLDMRNCGAGLGLARHPYHAGRSDDLATVVDAILQWCAPQPTSPAASGLVLCGVSLSGNILLKYLGENSGRVPGAVLRALAVNPPISLERSVDTLSGPINRWYDRHFVSTLLRQLEDLRCFQPDVPQPILLRRPRRLREFDDRYTAPLSGYADAADYYQRASAAQFIPHIATPTLILTATDDPLIPVRMFQQEQPRWPDSVQLALVHGGGHVGYIARRGVDPDEYWLDARVVEFVTAD